MKAQREKIAMKTKHKLTTIHFIRIIVAVTVIVTHLRL